MISLNVSALLTLVSAVTIAAESAAPDAANAPSPAFVESPNPNSRSAKRRSDVIPPQRATSKVPLLPPRPPLPDGVADLSFEDFYKMPIGPRGMEFTDKIKALNGKRVRLAGFQVVEMVGVCNSEPNAGSPVRRARASLEASVPGRLLLGPTPESVNVNHYGLCEDLPPQIVAVTVSELFGQIVPQHPGPLLLTGVLDLGNRQEPDGRISAIRLALDPNPAIKTSSTPLPAQPVTAASTQPNTTANNTNKQK